MALFRCNKCNHIREVGNDYIGKIVKCPNCSQAVQIYETVEYVKALLKKYSSQNKILRRLQENSTEIDNINILTSEKNLLENVNIYNTKELTYIEKYTPLIDWFENKNIKVQIDETAIDTTGFFDEIALTLGNNYKILKFVSDQIKYVQNKGYDNVKLELSKKSAKEIKEITSFCKEMHEYSFVAKYYYQKKEKIIRLTLQTAPKIRYFFNGIWMEWYILIKLLEFFQNQKLNISCMRYLNIVFSNGDKNELDIFFLIKNKIPVYIECKTGEFRQDIDKYLKLRKKLKINKDQFLICIFGLSNEQCQGMTSMYDMTFVNENIFIDHIKGIK